MQQFSSSPKVSRAVTHLVGYPARWVTVRNEFNGNAAILNLASYPVIPAWMPESSHKDVNLRNDLSPIRSFVVAANCHPGRWIPASMPE